MINNKVVGVITKINETEHISIRDGKTLDKKTCLVKTDDNFPQEIEIEFTGNKEHMLNQFAEGQQVLINVNIKCRSWKNPQGVTKHFVSLSGWKIETHGNNPELPPATEEDDTPFT